MKATLLSCHYFAKLIILVLLSMVCFIPCLATDPAVDDVIFKEEWGGNNIQAGNYTFTGTTTWSGSTTGLSYSSTSNKSLLSNETAKPITTDNFFFEKNSASTLTMSGIAIPSNVTKISISFVSNKTNINCTYSFTDGEDYATGATSKSGTQSFEISCKDKSTLYLKFTKTGTSSNARLDDIIITVTEVSNSSSTCAAPTGVGQNKGSVNSTQQIDVSWTKADGVSNYDIYYNTTNSNISDGTEINLGDVNSYTIPNLTPGRTYYVWVRSRCSDTDQSSWVAATPASITLPINVKLSKNGVITDLGAQEVGYTLPTPTADDSEQGGCEDWRFIGWSKSTAGQSNTDALTLVTQADEAGTYYAVYKHTGESNSGSNGSVSADATALKANLESSYKTVNFTLTDNSSNTYTANAVAIKSTNTTTKDWMQVKKAGDSGYIEIPTLPGIITNISISKLYNTQGSNWGGTMYFNSTASTTNPIASTESLSNVSSINLDISGSSATSGYILFSSVITINDITITYQATPIYYSSTATCGPQIKAEKNDYYVTSTKDVKVKLTIPISAQRFAANDSKFDISVETSDLSIATSDALNGSAISTSGTDGDLVLEFMPNEYDYRKDIKVYLCDTKGYSKVGDDCPYITIHARSLPQEFVLVAKNSSDYYALPAKNFSGTTAATYEAIPVVPESDMSKVKAVSSTLVYGLTGVAASNYESAGQYVRLFGNGNKMLTATAETKINNDAVYTSSSADDKYHWELITSDGVTYNLRNVKQDALLKYYASENKFGKYVNGQATFYILPFDCKTLPIRVSEEVTDKGATITFTENEDAEYSIVVKNGGSEVYSDSEISSPYTITGLDGTTAYTYTIYTDDENEDCAYTGSFTTLAAPFTVVLQYEGGSDNVTVPAGGTFTLPTQAAPNGYTTAVANACDEWVFVGWSATALATDNTTKPTYSTSATAAGTYYAVYKHSESGSSATNYTLTITPSDFKGSTTGYATTISEVDAIDDDDNTNKMTVSHSESGDVGNVSSNIQFKNASAYFYNTTDLDSITSISTGNNDIKYLINSESNPSESGSGGFFKIYNSSSSYQTTKSITIKFTVGSGTTYYSTTPACCTEVSKPEVTVGAKGTSATFIWNEQADTTSYEVTVTTESAGAPTPAVGKPTATGVTITNLQTATTYQYTVKVNGTTCSNSTSGEFDTEQTSMVISGWTVSDSDYSGEVILDLNEAIDAILIIEGEHQQTEDEVQQYADGLFFSKYFEADSENKLLAIYNGTQNKIDLSNYCLKRSEKGNPEKTWELSSFGRNEMGYIYPNEEIILIRYAAQSDKSAEACASEQDGYGNWYVFDNNTTEGNFLNFSGPQSIGLYDKFASKFVDVIGATTSADGTGSLCQIDANSKKPCADAKQSFNDASGFYTLSGDNYKTEEVETNYGLSTNRCLLIRKNTVKSGLNAVATNVYSTQEECSASIAQSFVTLASEWAGMQIGSEKSGDETHSQTCVGMGDVGGFDYNTYYVKYESLAEPDQLEKFKSKDDGTYHVTVDDLQKRSCTNVRIEVKDNNTGRIISAERQVPIFVTKQNTTTDQIFQDQGEKCATCDVVIMTDAQLTKAADGSANDYPQVHNIEVYPGGKLYVPAGTNYTVNQLLLRSTMDNVPVVDIQGTLTRKDGYIFHSKRIDYSRWYNFALPYDCRISDVYFNTGADATYGIDWLLETYDGERRAQVAKAEGNWHVVDATEEPIIKAGYGYMIAVAYDPSVKMKELVFPPYQAYSDEDEYAISVGAWGAGEDITPNHKGWNLIGNPYLTNYLKNYLNESGKITLGALDLRTKDDGTEDKEYYRTSDGLPYVVLPIGGGNEGYDHAKVSDVQLDPLKSYFVQVGGDDGDKMTGTDLVVFFKASHQDHLGIRRRITDEAELSLAPVNIDIEVSNQQGETDHTGLVISDLYTDKYELQADLTKWRASKYKKLTRPVLASVAEDGERSFDALPEYLAAAGVPLTLFTKDVSKMTFRLLPNNDWTQYDEVVLYDKLEERYINLLTDTYTFTSNAGENTNRFLLFAKIKHQNDVVTSIDATSNINMSVQNGSLILGNLPANALVYLYDMNGKLLAQKAAQSSLVLTPPNTGVYNIRIVSNEGSQTMRTIVK